MMSLLLAATAAIGIAAISVAAIVALVSLVVWIDDLERGSLLMPDGVAARPHAGRIFSGTAESATQGGHGRC